MKLAAALALLVASLGAAELQAQAPTLIVHEWGTFTSFQDPRGNTIVGINVDDEPVPSFVHRLTGLPIFTTRSMPATWSQGAPRCHPKVTMRLETPVLYFYPKPGFPTEHSIDVRATFVGGWLTEYFPTAATGTPGFPDALDASTHGSLHWSGLTLGADSGDPLPHTTQRVWLAPRAVKSAVVIGRDSREVEKYLFYRGVGKVDAPIVVRQTGETLTVALRDGQDSLERLPPMWIVRVLPNGRVVYGGVQSGDRRTATVPVPADDPPGSDRLEALRRELETALAAEGLFADEARAMLATWQLSYFESEGLRLFFILPAAWIEARLPLAISPPAATTRVMLGRVELVSPHQRTMLERLQVLPDSALDLTPLYYETYQDVWSHLHDGSKSHSELYRLIGRQVPEALELYESLGRFRDALLAHELRTTTDAHMQTRLQLIIDKFSSCVPEP